MNLPPGYEVDQVFRLEANLDDLSPEITGAVFEKLLAQGALDVWLTPIQMKKNRPGVLLAVLAEAATLERLTTLIFTETSTFGLRVEEITRLKLERRFEQVRTEFGEVTVKIGTRNGQVLQVAPEFESVRALSELVGQPLRHVYESAQRAYAAAAQS